MGGNYANFWWSGRPGVQQYAAGAEPATTQRSPLQCALALVSLSHWSALVVSDCASPVRTLANFSASQTRDVRAKSVRVIGTTSQWPLKASAERRFHSTHHEPSVQSIVLPVRATSAGDAGAANGDVP